MMTREMLGYFKGRWPDDIVPEGESLWMFYEVAIDRDVVTRLVEQFPDGHSIRDSIALAEREGPDQRKPEHRSLVHGPFLELSHEDLIRISEDEFSLLWDGATDKPWPPESECQ